MSDYPEHEKLDQVMKLHEFTQILGEQLDFGNYRIVKIVDDEICDVCGCDHWYVNINEALADIFGIDYKKLSDEKDQMLNRLRELNEK